MARLPELDDDVFERRRWEVASRQRRRRRLRHWGHARIGNQLRNVFLEPIDARFEVSLR